MTDLAADNDNDENVAEARRILESMPTFAQPFWLRMGARLLMGVPPAKAEALFRQEVTIARMRAGNIADV